MDKYVLIVKLNRERPIYISSYQKDFPYFEDSVAALEHYKIWYKERNKFNDIIEVVVRLRSAR